MWKRLVAMIWVIAACASAGAQLPALLPRVQNVRYKTGSIALCSLVVPDPAGVDGEAAALLREIVRSRCAQPALPAVPVRMEESIAGPSMPGTDDSAASQAGPNGREAYTISIDANSVRLTGRTSAGLFYAVETLRQLVEGPPAAPTLPFVEIVDWPSLAYRGFMMDMSHGAVLTLDEVKRQIDELSRWKANQYFLYVETTIDLKGFPLLNRDSNWSADDIHAIVAYAAARHIDIVPCVELYGHLHDLFRIERYSDMAALPHGGEANPADKQVQALLENWLRQYAALFPSPWLHLGFDEPFELERAGSKAAGGVAPDVLWLQHLQRMARLTADLGKRPLFWADIDEGAYIFNKYPGLAAGLPKGAIAVPWFYDARPDYSHLLDLFSANHVPILVATGISDWDTISPDFDSTFINVDGFLDAGRKAGALGMLHTEWSDSALALHREATPAMAYGAIAAWQKQPVDRPHFFAEYAHLRYAPSSEGKVADALSALARSQTLLRVALGPETSFRMWDDPFEPATLARVTQQAAKLREARLSAENAEELLLEASAAGAPKDDVASLLLAARMDDYTGMKFLYAGEIAANFAALPSHPSTADISYLLKRETSSRNHSRVGDLMDISGELKLDYRAEWEKQYKPFRLETALTRWDAEQLYWRHFQASVWTATRNFKQGDERPTLEGVLSLR